MSEMSPIRVRVRVKVRVRVRVRVRADSVGGCAVVAISPADRDRTSPRVM